ncbi:MAG TPA: Spo0B domain-containing protein [Bacillota bacterium]|nr:Spo0B domain-containing protein [Bacillota bacterium]
MRGGVQAETLATLSAWRHELANELQVISGYLQLGQPTVALERALEVGARLRRLDRLFTLKAPGFALALLTERSRAQVSGVVLELEIDSDLAGVPPEDEPALAAAIADLLRAAVTHVSGSDNPALSLLVAEDSAAYHFRLSGAKTDSGVVWPRVMP